MLRLLFLLLLVFPLSGENLIWERVGKGYERPIDLVPLPVKDGEKPLFLLVEQGGKVFLTSFSGRDKKALDWSRRVTRSGNEQGFLCVALSPDFKETGRAYFNVNNKDGDTEVWRYYFDLKDYTREARKPELLLTFEQPYKNHNGGWLGFGPDGMLYIATGDGGAANDPKNLAQDMSSFHGKVLRIDVSPNKGYRIPKDNPFQENGNIKPEIYSSGLRNPWRCTWDGDMLYLADVGQNAWEEVNAVRLEEMKGKNFGWRLREGEVSTPKRAAKGKKLASDVGGSKPSDAIEPVIVYTHDTNEDFSGLSITGGEVYRGKISSLKGRYFFADYILPKVWSISLDSKKDSHDLQSHTDTIKPDKGQIQSISDFSSGHDGELYLLTLTGEVFRLEEED